MIRVRLTIESIPFKETRLAKGLLWFSRLGEKKHERMIHIKTRSLNGLGRYERLIPARWNFRIAMFIATAIKTWEENREAAKVKARWSEVTKKMLARPHHVNPDYAAQIQQQLAHLSYTPEYKLFLDHHVEGEIFIPNPPGPDDR